MSTIRSELRPVARVPLWRNVRVLRVVAQIVALVLAGYAVWTLLDNLTDNLSAVGISTDFGVLGQDANFQIRDDPGFDPQSPVVPNLMWVAVKNGEPYRRPVAA